jgi:type II secretory pathway pseudopilin PulG
MFDHDDKRLTWFASQLDREATYLDALARRIQAVHATAASVIGAASARRRERLTLLQTSFIGALLMALAAIQALQYTIAIPPALNVPVISVLATAAFALPLLMARWSGLAPRTEPYRWFDLAAAALGSTLGWFGISLVWQIATEDLVPPWAITLAILMGALALLLPTWRVSRRKRTAQQDPTDGDEAG